MLSILIEIIYEKIPGTIFGTKFAELSQKISFFLKKRSLSFVEYGIVYT